MNSYSFSLVLDGPPEFDEAALDAFFDAGCGDATFQTRNGEVVAEFDREAPSLSDALITAIRDADGAGTGYRVVRVEPDDLVSLTEIAKRAGRSKESVRLLAAGKRGAKRSERSFPRPRGQIGRTKLWSWAEVAEWFDVHNGKRLRSSGVPHFITALNGVLATRSAVGKIAEGAREGAAQETREVSAEAVSALPGFISPDVEDAERQLALAGPAG